MCISGSANDDRPILEVKGLSHFFQQKGLFFKKHTPVYALWGVDLSLKPGEVLGIVGESGSGKSTLLRSIARLLLPYAGEIIFEQKNITHMTERQLLPLRKDMQMIFQDPYASLNPRMTALQIISEPLQIFKKHGFVSLQNREIEKRAATLMDKVGLSADMLGRFPHQFSGGQRQRIGIARALAPSPKLLLCDEPVSALDACVQTQVLHLLLSLQKQENLACIFVSHDLSVVHYIADRIMVMYRGHVLETGNADELYHHPLHPYTQSLLSAAPRISSINKMSVSLPKNDKKISLNINENISFCPFAASCPHAQRQCTQKYPILHRVKNNHTVACFFSKK